MAEQGNSVALIRHRRLQSAHFCPQTTQELPKKQGRNTAPLKCVTDALSQIDYTLDTMKTAKRFACANKGHFGKFMKGYAHG